MKTKLKVPKKVELVFKKINEKPVVVDYKESKPKPDNSVMATVRTTDGKTIKVKLSRFSDAQISLIEDSFEKRRGFLKNNS